MAANVKSLGQGLLSAKEKRTAEAYSVLCASHETTAFRFAMEFEMMVLNKADVNLEVLQYSRS